MKKTGLIEKYELEKGDANFRGSQKIPRLTGNAIFLMLGISGFLLLGKDFSLFFPPRAQIKAPKVKAEAKKDDTESARKKGSGRISSVFFSFPSL